MVLFIFSSSDMRQSHHLVRCHATDINSLLISFFTCLALFLSITPSIKSNMDNSFRTIIVKTNIIKANIIKIYSNKTHIITKNVTLSESALTKIISSLKNTTSAGFSSNVIFQAVHADQCNTQEVPKSC